MGGDGLGWFLLDSASWYEGIVGPIQVLRRFDEMIRVGTTKQRANGFDSRALCWNGSWLRRCGRLFDDGWHIGGQWFGSVFEEKGIV